jgi:hypothetical protein
MGKDVDPPGEGRATDRPADVAITVVWDPDDRSGLNRFIHGRGLLIAFAVTAMAVLAVVLTPTAGHHRIHAAPAPGTTAMATDGAVPARHPPHRVTITVDSGHRAHGRVKRGHAPACGPSGDCGAGVFQHPG